MTGEAGYGRGNGGGREKRTCKIKDEACDVPGKKSAKERMRQARQWGRGSGPTAQSKLEAPFR